LRAPSAAITFHEAHAAYAKNEFWTIRARVMVYADEKPAS
jgi:hypothetical protein